MSRYETKTPKKNGRPRKKLGRPTIMNEQVLDKLEYAFSIGCSDLEACLHAGISPEALYKYQRKNPLFIHRKELLKEKVALKARQTVAKSVTNDVHTAQWYLERRKRHEFGIKIEQDTNVNINFVNGIPRPKVIESDAISSVPKQIEANKG